MRTLLIGPKNSGKMTVASLIEGSEKPLKKVANIVYYKKTIIVPDSYLESPWMHKHLIALQQSAFCGIFLQPLGAKKRSYPPNFAKVFRIPIHGVLTYQKQYTKSNLENASQQLFDCGINQIDLLFDLTKDNYDQIEKLIGRGEEDE
ncbi:EutP/PduV family microcompartment system protein [Enterococcus sp. S86.2]|uniref:EutP/PduV family microcompartment system protein n=1 Tax=Enterococcus sp. S86.2 TaxID=3031299 RepID=UPI0026EB5CE3|nr:EutP/PduV family microcompartment system protein [Enterococcus sp. S86.2]